MRPDTPTKKELYDLLDKAGAEKLELQTALASAKGTIAGLESKNERFKKAIEEAITVMDTIPIQIRVLDRETSEKFIKARNGLQQLLYGNKKALKGGN